ncbi:MAG: outer membrane lipoprotein-sorting protein, partial [Brevinematales bacterium]
VSNMDGQDIFELTAKVPAAPYQRILLWWDRVNQRIVREYFYTRTGVLLKQAHYLAHQQVKGYFFAVKIEIQDALQTNKRTVLEVVDLKEKNLSEGIFYPEALDYLPYIYK